MVEILRNINHLPEVYSRLPVFATKEYLSTKSRDYGWLLNEEFLLPFCITRLSLFKRIQFPSQTICIRGDASLECEKIFLNKVVQTVKQLNVHFIMQPPANALFRTFPDHAPHTVFGTYKLDLSLTENQLFLNFHSKHRNMVRKAQRDGVIIKSGIRYLETGFHNCADTMKRSNMSYLPLSFLKELARNLKENLTVYIAERDGSIQGSAIIPWNKFSAYYFAGGRIKNPSPGALNLLHWQVLKDMKNKGVQWYDLMGARIDPSPYPKLVQIQRFKSRFGGQLHKGFLWKYPLNKVYSRFYGILLRSYGYLSRKPYRGDLIDQEGAE